MKAVKRILSTALSAVLSINLTAVAVPAISASAQEQEEQTLIEVLKNGISNFETVIDIKQFDYRMGDISLITEAVNKVIMDPELFYLRIVENSTKCGGSYNDAGEVVLTSVKLQYENTPEDVAPLIEQFNSKVDEILGKTIKDDMTEVEKALKLHDYIVLNTKYDLSGEIEDYNDGISAYDILVMGNGVCQGYAQAYGYLLDRIGIESMMVTSEIMAHAWNLVKIDGEWYHVDVTWDDPVPDAVGRVNHSYFMLSDSAILCESDTRATAHHDWDSEGVTAQSTKYDDAFWGKVGTEIFIDNGQWYFISDTGEYSTYVEGSGQVNTNVSLDEERWYVWNEPDQFWTGKYTSLIVSGGKVYYNTPTMIYSMNLDGSCKEGLKYVNPYETDGYMYGLVLENDKLYAVIKQAPTDEGKLVEVMDLHLENYSYIATMLKSIEDMNDGESTVFDMTEERVFPSQALELIKGRDIEVVLEVDTYSWAINGQSVGSSATRDINLEINKNQGEVPEDMLTDIAQGKDTVELDLEHNGEFGFVADISYNIGSEFSERPATLYYYNEAENKMDKVQEVVINNEGAVTISLNHASSYVVVMDNVSVPPNDMYKDPQTTTDSMQQLPQQETAIGDVSGDGEIDLTDLTKISLHLLNDAKIADELIKYADVTFDGIVDLCDLATMKQYIIKDITSFTK